MKPLALGSSLLAIVGSVVSLTLPATAINVAYFAKTTQILYFPPVGGQELRLAEILLPRGKWIVNYSATAANDGTNGYVRCYVRASETGEILSIHAAVLGTQPGASIEPIWDLG